MCSIRMWFSVYVLVTSIELTKCDCDTFYECASGFFNDFFNRFAAINSKNTEHFSSVKDFAINESVFNVYSAESPDKSFDKVISNSIYSTTNDSNTNETGALEFFKIDLFVPNVNTTVIIKNIQNEFNDFKANVPEVDFLADKENVDIGTDIPFSITYVNNTVNIEHDDFTEVVVKTNTVNIKDHNSEDRSHSLSVLDEILLDYEDDYPDNSTDYPVIDYVEVFEDRIEPVAYGLDDEDITANVENKNNGNHTKEPKREFENFIDYFDNGVYDGEHHSEIDDKKDMSLSRNITREKNSTKLRICGDNDSGGNIEDAIFSWTAAIFLKSPNHADFSYACDGVVLSRRHVVSARKCFNSTASEADVLLVVGKRSLRDVAEKEAAYKIYRIIFQNNTEENDLAILETEIDIEFNEIVKSACISLHENIARINAENAIAVGYNASNDLSVINLVKNSRSQCLHRGTGAHNDTTELLYCVKVQEGDTVCPNLGSAYVTQSMEPPTMNPLAILTDRHGDCHETLSFTSLLENLPWIEENVNS